LDAEELAFLRRIKTRYPKDRDVLNLVDMFDMTDTALNRMEAMFKEVCAQRDEAFVQRDLALAACEKFKTTL
jgi:hypothetical protein